MNKSEIDTVQPSLDGKKTWEKPAASSEPVRTVTRGPTGSGGDSFNSCHS